MKRSLLALAFVFLANSASAAITFFDLVGTAGSGLLPGNEPGAVVGGTGGEIGAGIFFDDATNLLTINVGWGSTNGFTNLSSNLTAAHIHGPTPNNNGLGFTQTAGVAIGLTPSGNAASGGVFTDPPILLSAGQATDLSNGKFYINIHTVTNGGGEMRGFLVPVPEPATSVLGLLALGALAGRRRRA